MQRTLPFYVIVILLTSCSRYQYGTIQSPVLSRNEQQEFVAENDSLRLVYNFNGRNAPINLTVYNKLNVPVAIDWRRSSLIIGDVAYSYVPDKVPITGSFDGTTSTTSTNSVNGYAFTAGSIQATANVPEQLAFIPPQTKATESPINLITRFMGGVPDTAFHTLKYSPAQGPAISIQKATFTEANSPLRFKSYLTVKVGYEPAQPMVYEHAFYVSELINTRQSSLRMWMGGTPPGNQYFVQRSTGGAAGVFVGFALAGAALIGIGTQAANNHPAGN